MVSVEFEYLCSLLRERSGIVLTSDKQNLAENRLLSLARRFGLDSVSDLVRSLSRPDGEARIVAVIEAVTTNETMFFRDKVPFAHFRDVMLPRLLKARAGHRLLRIWCAAASMGQEPYSIAMCLKERADELAGWQIEILATDLSSDALDYAKDGVYSQFDVQRGVPIRSLLQHFSKADHYWQISTELRSMVRFERFNLLDDFAGMGTFDVVFCRNVLVYFDPAIKIDVLERMSRVVGRDGYLVLGTGETAAGLTDRFQPSEDCDGLFAANPVAMIGSQVRAAPHLVAVGGH